MENPARVSGWAALAYGIVFIITFVSNAVGSMVAPLPDYPTPDDMQGQFLLGVPFSICWAALGTAVIVASVALSRTAWTSDTIASRVASAAGCIAAVGFFLSSASVFIQRTANINDYIAGAGADKATEKAIVEAMYELVQAGGYISALGFLIWLPLVAIGAARGKTLSRLAVVLLWVAGLAPAGLYWITGAQYGLLLTIIAFVILGITLIRRSRTDAARPVPISEAAPTI